MSIELQKIDCNCNDCAFMVRDFERFEKSVAFHKKMQEDHYEGRLERMEMAMIERANKHENEAAVQIWKEIDKARYIFNKSAVMISYGNCSKFNKPVSFIPNTCQLQTQNCFVHRKELTLKD